MEQKKYFNLSEELEQRILEDRRNGYQNPYRTKEEDAIRRKQNWDRNKLLRPAYVRDCEKIITITDMRIRRRYFPFIKMMISAGARSMFSWYPAFQEISEHCLA